MKFNASQIMVIIALSLGILSVTAGIVVQALPSNSSVSTQVGVDVELTAAPSLNPNLKAEACFGTNEDDQVVFASSYESYLYVFYNSGQTEGYVCIIDRLLGEAKSVAIGGRVVCASLCEGGFIVGVQSAEGYGCVWLDFLGQKTAYSEFYQNQTVCAAYSYADGQAVVYYCENQAENNLILRFYRQNQLVLERYAGSMYQMRLVDTYRISNNFILFFHYYSQFSSGAGYVGLSFDGISAKCNYVELSYEYDFLDVCPFGEGYALLTSGEKGSKIYLLDHSLNRSKAIPLSDKSVENGRLFFDGQNYSCFIGGSNGGMAVTFDSSLSVSSLPSYSQITHIAHALHYQGGLVQLGYVVGDGGAVIMHSEAGFSKRLGKTDYLPTFIVSHELGLAVVGQGKLRGSTLTSRGGNDVYVAILN